MGRRRRRKRIDLDDGEVAVSSACEGSRVRDRRPRSLPEHLAMRTTTSVKDSNEESHELG